MKAGLVICLLFTGNGRASSLTPLLSSEALLSLQNILRATAPLEQSEQRYQRRVHSQIIHDLILLYDPANARHVKTTYASFTPESHMGGGEDGGFGLHIVKRLVLPLANGETKIVYVNELWPQDSVTGALFAPDEIRVQTLFRPTDMSKPGSHEDFLFDSIRLAWGPGPAEVKFARQSIHPRSKQLRVNVSAPFSCRECHETINSLGDNFLSPGERKNFGAIVQDSQFELPVTEMRGLKEYLRALVSQGRSQTMILQAEKELQNIEKASALPDLLPALEMNRRMNGVEWLESDSIVSASNESIKQRQGSYIDSKGRVFIDSLEEVVEGKYRWWFPQIRVPLLPPSDF